MRHCAEVYLKQPLYPHKGTSKVCVHPTLPTPTYEITLDVLLQSKRTHEDKCNVHCPFQITLLNAEIRFI